MAKNIPSNLITKIDPRDREVQLEIPVRESEIITEITKIEKPQEECRPEPKICPVVIPILINKVDPEIIDKITSSDLTIEELKKLLVELFIRFDTSPKELIKDDYKFLVILLIRAFLDIYGSQLIELVNEWGNPPSSEAAPSEKLVKDTFDFIEGSLDEIKELLLKEISDRQSDVLELTNSITEVSNNLTEEIETREQLILDINLDIQNLLPLIYAGL